MKSLGYTPPKRSEGETDIPMPVGGDERKERFPELRMNGEQAAAAGLTKCSHGDEYEMTVRVRATRIGGESYDDGSKANPAMEFEVLSADTPRPVASESKDTEKPKKQRPKAKKLSPKDAGLAKEEY